MSMWRAATLAGLVVLGGCPSAAPRPEPEPAPRTDVDGWFAVREVGCERVMPALGVAATMRAGEASPWHTEVHGAWCTVAAHPGHPKVRMDSLAREASRELGATAIAFYVAEGAWSYLLVERGETVFALESHLGRPMTTGDAARAGALTGVPPEVFIGTEAEGQTLARCGAFCARLGLAGLCVDEAGRPVSPSGPAPEDPRDKVNPEATLRRIPPGTWAALPPLGVVLVKGVEARDKDGVAVPTYVIVDDMTTLELPVTRAERMGMRPLAGLDEVNAVLARIEDGVKAPEGDYDVARTKRWLDAMKSGVLGDIARVYMELCAISGERKLYQVESGLLATSREWLAEELATARQEQVDRMEERLREACD